MFNMFTVFLFLLWWLLHIQFYHILFICFGELIIILFPDAFLCISMIFYSLSYMFIQIYYSCFFTHFNNIFKYMVLCSICLQFFYFYYPVLFSPFIFIIIWIPLPAFLSIIIKAYSMGIFNCHTTNILIRWFYCVHWIKPPFHKFPINISHRHMKYFLSL